MPGQPPTPFDHQRAGFLAGSDANIGKLLDRQNVIDDACEEPDDSDSDSESEVGPRPGLQEPLKVQMLSRPMAVLPSAKEQLLAHPALLSLFKVRKPSADRSAATTLNTIRRLIEEGLSES